MIKQILFSLFGFFLDILKLAAMVILPFVALFLLSYFLHVLYFRKIKKMKSPEPRYELPKISSKEMTCRPRAVWEIPKLIYLDTCRQMAKDHIRRDPSMYPYSGLKFICARQGGGKSFTAANYAYDMRARYPSLHITSNMKLGCEDLSIDSLDDIPLEVGEEYCGSLIILDEAQILSDQYSYKQKNYNVTFLHELACQQRKRHREIIIITQVANNVNIEWRRQMYYFLKPVTYFGCLTCVWYYVVNTDSKTGDITKAKIKLERSFVIPHTDENRNRYDTYQIIRGVEKHGLKPLSEQLDTSPTPQTLIAIDKKLTEKK